jgi:hypothetical protein
MGIDLVFLMTPFFVLQLTLRVRLLSNIFDITELLKSLSTNCMVLFASTIARISRVTLSWQNTIAHLGKPTNTQQYKESLQHLPK